MAWCFKARLSISRESTWERNSSWVHLSRAAWLRISSSSEAVLLRPRYLRRSATSKGHLLARGEGPPLNGEGREP